MKQILGNISGLKVNQKKRLENFYKRRVSPYDLISAELARDMGKFSFETGCQVGVLINRSGKIEAVIAGDHQQIIIPVLSQYRYSPGRLRGIRCVHTHLSGEALSKDDLTDLALLRLDLMAAITLDAEGFPGKIYMAHILPESESNEVYRVLPPVTSGELDIGCKDLIYALESELSALNSIHAAGSDSERALLVSVSTDNKKIADVSLKELTALTESAGIHVISTIIQRRKSVDSRFLMGLGKLNELAILTLYKGATLIIFDQELNPSQIRSITDKIEIKVIDRTQLILDIFAQRAKSSQGKLQVELAQLKYLLPRLITKNTAMSRLTGGIGGRGPGETKLEINRRRVRENITKLGKKLKTVTKQRRQQRAKRQKKGLPVISIVGYTNAGKSTLLNTLTQSNVIVENQLFATLDPSSRRLRFPKDIEVIITDTVGFIKNLPKELMTAFKATLEELKDADLLLNVVDISNPDFREQIESVDNILSELDIKHIPAIYLFNKIDLAEPERVENIIKKYNGLAVCAKDQSTLTPLLEKMFFYIQ